MERMRKRNIISRSKIKSIVRESIDKILSVPEKKSYDDIFDLSKFPKELLRRNYVSYSPYRLTASHGSPLQIDRNGNFLSEGIDHKSNAEEAKRDIISHYPIDVRQFIIVESFHGLYAAVLVADIKGNIDIIKGCMAQHNFFPSTHVPDITEISIDGQEWVDMRFEPIEQDDVTDEIRNNNSVLYHLSPSAFEESILENGLMASNSNPIYKYPTNRVHLMEESASKSDIRRLAKDLYRQAVRKNIKFLKPIYTLFSVDLSKVPESVRFYYDINEEFGLFATKNIDRKAIKKIMTIKAI